MSKENLRKDFEMWAESTLGLSVRRTASGSYQSFGVYSAWEAWQASRECLVIDLPNRFDEKYQDYYDDVEGGCFNECRYISDVQEALTAAGVKYK